MNYNATGDQMTFGNFVAFIGGSWNDGPRNYSAYFERPYSHSEIMVRCGSLLGC